jgi:beta-mannanase
MDRPNLTDVVHSPADYLAAWRHIRAIFAAEGVDNVAWVWCPTATGFVSGRAQPYYPGDNEVDWVCVDAYTSADYTSLEALIAPFLSWAAHHPKPIIIGEFGARDGEPGQREKWLEAAAHTAKAHPQIKALVYFNVDAHRNGKVYPWSLGSSPSALKTFAAIGADPYFNTRSD